eukprot:9605126-Alexandrium_andersonii.AAC.1
MVAGPSGPTSRPACLTHHDAADSQAPKPRALPECIKDDEVSAGPQPGLVFLRLTLSREFTDPALWAKVAKAARSLPGYTLGEVNSKLVVATKAAVSYADEVTCLIQARESNSSALLNAELPFGAFISPHRTGARPLWIARPQDGTPAAYLALVKAKAEAAEGRVAFKANGRNCLGVAGASRAVEGASAPRWLISHAPPW